MNYINHFCGIFVFNKKTKVKFENARMYKPAYAQFLKWNLNYTKFYI